MTSLPSALVRGRGWLEGHVGGAGEQRRLAGRIAAVAGVVVVLCTAVLIVDHAVGLWRDAGQKARIVDLEGQTKEDAEVAAVLHEERKGQTDASLARETRGRALAWVLLMAGGAFVGAGKWWVSLGPEAVPTLEELVAVRLGGVSREGREAGAKKREQGRRAEGVGAAETVDLRFVDGLVDRFGRDKEAAIPLLQAIQSHYRYLPDEALRHVCEKTEITPAQIAGTSSFYSQFRRSPVGQYVVRVCHGTACHVAGAEQITEELRRHLEIPPDADTDSQRLFTLDKVACLGCCSLAPVMMIEEDTAGRLTPATARQALDTVARRP